MVWKYIFPERSFIILQKLINLHSFDKSLLNSICSTCVFKQLLNKCRQTCSLYICALSISNIFFLFQKLYLFNETQYMRHCKASRSELNTYVRQYTITWLIDPEHVTHSVKSLTWFNWFTDNKNIISSVHRPNNTHLKSQVDYGRTMLQIAHIPLQKRGKGGAYVDIIRLRSMTY